MLSAAVLLCGCLPAVMEAHRPAEKLLNLAADPEDRDVDEMTDEVPSSVEDSSAENSSESARQVTFWPKNGWTGLEVAPTGAILHVYKWKQKGSQANKLGLNTSQRITQVSGQRFTLAKFEQARKGLYKLSVPFSITIETQSEGEVAFRSALSYMELPAGIVGFLLFLCLPWITYKTFASGSQVLGEIFSYPLMLVVVSAFALRAVAVTALQLLDWFQSGCVVVGAGEILGFVGLAWAVLSNYYNPLLDAQ